MPTNVQNEKVLLPLQPLIDRLPGHINASTDAPAGLFGIGIHRWRKMRRSGTVPADLADQLANRLGDHPGFFWPAGWRDYINTADIEDAEAS
jgi:hypothetical protein